MMISSTDLSPTNPTFPGEDGPSPLPNDITSVASDGVDPPPPADTLMLARETKGGGTTVQHPDGGKTTVNPDGSTDVKCPAGKGPVVRPTDGGSGMKIECEGQKPAPKEGNRSPGGAPILDP
jgi:hypothetical protein